MKNTAATNLIHEELLSPRYRARHLELGEILTYIRDHAADRECWDNADQGTVLVQSL